MTKDAVPSFLSGAMQDPALCLTVAQVPSFSFPSADFALPPWQQHSTKTASLQSVLSWAAGLPHGLLLLRKAWERGLWSDFSGLPFLDWVNAMGYVVHGVMVNGCGVVTGWLA